MKKDKNKTTKIHNKEDKKKHTILYVILFVLIVGLFVGGYYITNPSDDVTTQKDYDIYNGFAFEKIGKYWQTMIERDGQTYEVPFTIHPLDLIEKNYTYDDRITEFILRVPHDKLVIAIEPTGGSIPVMAGVNIARITGKFYGLPTSSALYIPSYRRVEGMNYSAPIIECKESSINNPVIFLNVNASTEGIYGIDQYPGCVVLGANATANNKTIVELSDLFVYKILRIME